MELCDLAGAHLLTGIDFENEAVKEYSWSDRMVDSSACRFCLDGTVYVAAEDPDDGYRSSMRDLLISGRPIANSWPAVPVLCVHEDRDQYGYAADLLAVRDAKTGALILRVGTENCADYYPGYVAEYHPEALAHNAGGGGDAPG